jgi:hypothetical protein
MNAGPADHGWRATQPDEPRWPELRHPLRVLANGVLLRLKDSHHHASGLRFCGCTRRGRHAGA